MRAIRNVGKEVYIIFDLNTFIQAYLITIFEEIFNILDLLFLLFV